MRLCGTAALCSSETANMPPQSLPGAVLARLRPLHVEPGESVERSDRTVLYVSGTASIDQRGNVVGESGQRRIGQPATDALGRIGVDSASDDRLFQPRLGRLHGSRSLWRDTGD